MRMMCWCETLAVYWIGLLTENCRGRAVPHHTAPHWSTGWNGQIAVKVQSLYYDKHKRSGCFCIHASFGRDMSYMPDMRRRNPPCIPMCAYTVHYRIGWVQLRNTAVGGL